MCQGTIGWFLIEIEVELKKISAMRRTSMEHENDRRWDPYLGEIVSRRMQEEKKIIGVTCR